MSHFTSKLVYLAQKAVAREVAQNKQVSGSVTKILAAVLMESLVSHFREAARGNEKLLQIYESLDKELADVREPVEGWVSYPMTFTSKAMQPTISAGEHLIVRKFLAPQGEEGVPYEQVSVDDVVAFRSPFGSGTPRTLVRRIAAMEGDELESKVGTGRRYRIPRGKCWVLADNDATPSNRADDSRSFGPLKLKNIIGRVLYAVRNENDHGAIENSELSMAYDRCIIENELPHMMKLIQSSTDTEPTNSEQGDSTMKKTD